MKMKRSRLVVTIVIVACVAIGLALTHPWAAAERIIILKNAEGGLNEGWEQVIEIPAWKSLMGETILRSASVKMWVEQGWLSVRRIDSAGDVEWQVALAVANDETLPVVKIEEGTKGFELHYGPYFVRENAGWLRLLRQKKGADSPAWPQMEISENAPRKKMGQSQWGQKPVQLNGYNYYGWTWVMSGPNADKPDVWVRLEHQDVKPKGGYGFDGGPKPARMHYGDKYAIDEGDLFYAVRSLAENAERQIAQAKLVDGFTTKPAPPIVASEWLNSSAPMSLDQFHGKVVLLDFWGTWCGPCVENLPKIQALHEKYRDQGLIVIGVHTLEGGEGVAEFLKDRSISFPIAIDTGDTSKNYGIEAFPTYFLIDKTGKSTWGFSNQPPKPEQIEKLLQ